MPEHRWQDALRTFDKIIAAKKKRAAAALHWKAYSPISSGPVHHDDRDPQGKRDNDTLAEVYRATSDPQIKKSIIFMIHDAPYLVELARSEKDLEQAEHRFAACNHGRGGRYGLHDGTAEVDSR